MVRIQRRTVEPAYSTFSPGLRLRERPNSQSLLRTSK